MTRWPLPHCAHPDCPNQGTTWVEGGHPGRAPYTGFTVCAQHIHWGQIKAAKVATPVTTTPLPDAPTVEPDQPTLYPEGPAA